MKLLLSSDAAPDASMAGLARACHRRALSGLELTLGAGQGHGMDKVLSSPREQPDAPCATGEHGPIQWLKVSMAASRALLLTWASHAQRLGTGLLLPAPMASPPPGLRIAFIHGTSLAEARDAARWAHRYGASTCWEVSPGTDTPAAVEDVFDATSEHLAHVRYLGAGPEAETSDAAEPHSLWSLLARHGYAGTIALAPSSAGSLRDWRRWLFESRGWGCNTAAEKARTTPTTIRQPTTTS